MYKNKKPIKPRKCVVCSTEYTPKNGIQKVCSAKCAWKIAKPKKPSKPIKKKVTDHDKEFMEVKHWLRDAQIEERGHTYCEVCFKPCMVDCHHIIFRSEKPKHEHLNNKKNLILLCRKHHAWFHAVKGRRNVIVQERGLHKLFGDDVLDK